MKKIFLTILLSFIFLLSACGTTITPIGNTGPAGLNGQDGKSAYQIWLDNGYTGSESDFLEWLKGTDGKDGRDGIDGKDGTNGYNGKDGHITYEIIYTPIPLYNPIYFGSHALLFNTDIKEWTVFQSNYALQTYKPFKYLYDNRLLLLGGDTALNQMLFYIKENRCTIIENTYSSLPTGEPWRALPAITVLHSGLYIINKSKATAQQLSEYSNTFSFFIRAESTETLIVIDLNRTGSWAQTPITVNIVDGYIISYYENFGYINQNSINIYNISNSN